MSDLVIIMKDEGYDVSIDTQEEIDIAIRDDKLILIKKDNVVIGFFTYLDEFKNNQKQIWINNLIVFKSYRSKNNLLFIKKYLRDLFLDGTAYWKNNRRNVYVYAK